MMDRNFLSGTLLAYEVKSSHKV